jgi:hypothetical protein
MNLWGFLVGLIIGFFPVLLILKSLKGKLIFFENVYIKGAISGFFLWGVINVFLFFEARYDMFGLLRGEEGYATMVILTSSLQGFITAGLLAAFISKKIGKNSAKKGGRS